MDIRHFPEQDSRVECGPVQFGDDWPGVFLRGDHALHYAMTLECALDAIADPFAKAVLRGLANDLKSCDARMTVTPAGKAALRGES